MQPNRPRRSGKGTSDHKAWCPGRERRRSVIERGLVRIIATGGIIGVAAILGAVLRRWPTRPHTETRSRQPFAAILGCAAVMAAWAAVSKLVSSNGIRGLQAVVVGDCWVAESVDQWSGDAGLDWGDESQPER